MVSKVPTFIAWGGILVQLVQSVEHAKVGQALFDTFAFDFVWFNSLFEKPESYILDVSLTGLDDF